MKYLLVVLLSGCAAAPQEQTAQVASCANVTLSRVAGASYATECEVRYYKRSKDFAPQLTGSACR